MVIKANESHQVHPMHTYKGMDEGGAAMAEGRGRASRPLFAWQFVCVYCNFWLHSLVLSLSPSRSLCHTHTHTHTREYLRFKLHIFFKIYFPLCNVHFNQFSRLPVAQIENATRHRFFSFLRRHTRSHLSNASYFPLRNTRIRHNLQCSYAHTYALPIRVHHNTHTAAAGRGSAIREPPCATIRLQMKCNFQFQIRHKRKLRRRRRQRRRLLQK